MRVKLSVWASENGISRQTAYRMWRAGKLNGIQLPTGTILVEKEQNTITEKKRAVLYARVSSSQNKKNLESQQERLYQYALARGFTVINRVSEIGSGVNDSRNKLEKILLSSDWDVLIVEHKDRLTRFGFNYIESLLSRTGQTIEVINQAGQENEADLLEDLTSIITSFCARIYGRRRSQRKTERIIAELSSS